MESTTTSTLGHAFDLFGIWRMADMSRQEPVSIHILVDEGVSRELALTVRDALLPTRPTSTVRVQALTRGVPEGDLPDLALVLAGGSDALVTIVAVAYARAGVPICILADSVLDLPELALGGRAQQLVATIASTDQREVARLLARWIVRATTKATALAANFPFCRVERVRALVRENASRNAVAEAKDSITGADSSNMTASHVKLALDVAASYGRPFSMERMPDLLGVISADAGMSAMENSLLGRIPGIGWLFSAGVGYAGSYATGKAVAARVAHIDRKEEQEEQESQGDAEARPSEGASPLSRFALLLRPMVGGVR